MRGNRPNRLGVGKIIGKLGAGFGLAFHQGRAHFALAPEFFAQLAQQRGVLAHAFDQDGACAVQRRLGVGHASLGVDIGQRDVLRILCRVGQQAVGQRLQAGFAGNLRLVRRLGL